MKKKQLKLWRVWRSERGYWEEYHTFIIVATSVKEALATLKERRYNGGEYDFSGRWENVTPIGIASEAFDRPCILLGSWD